ncbi:MAG: ABC transporter ATP-binding protein [Lentisphaerae bacterium]|nr:ABC transporter ATP-binding protein [Lentisphaerota bacterium]
MALKEIQPPPPEALLSGPSPAEIAVMADLTPCGTFGEEWLVVTADRFRVYPSRDSAVPRVDVPLDSIDDAATEGLTGCGALLLTRGGETVEALRYSNAHQKKFARIARYLRDGVKYRKDIKEGREAKAPPCIEEDQGEQRRCPKCRLLLAEGSKVCPACLNKGRVLLRMLKYLRPYWKEVLFVWIAMFAGLAAGLVPPYLTRPLMDRVLAPAGGAAPLADRLRLLGLLVLGLLGALVLSQAIGILRQRIVVRLGVRVSHDMRVQLYSHLQWLSLRFFQKRPVGGILTRVISDTMSLEQVLVDGIQHFVVNILTLLGIGVVLFAMNWKLTLVVLVPVPVVLLISRLFWERVHSLWHRYWHYRSRLSATVNDAISGIRVVKAFAKEDEEIVRFRQNSHALLRADSAAEQTWSTFFPILWFFISTGSLLVWYFGGRSVLGGTITLGTLMTFQAYLAMFYGPLQFLSRIADYLARALTSAERVFEILDSEPEVRERGDAVRIPELKGRVELRNVTFGYEAHKVVLHNLNLDVRQGEMIGLVGRSGAGKTTIINLICRFYDTLEGEILIDGIDIRNIRQKDLRSQIGVVLQDTFLFNGTIAENIAYARPGAALGDVIAAAKAANAHDFIVQKTDGYDTKVGERGQSVSAGERQRISIARAILHNPKILILDEATAAVDIDTERQIQEAIKRLVCGRTTFAIAHRLSTLRNADRLLVIKEGKIAEMGTHEQLLGNKDGEFARMAEMYRELSSVVEVT